MHSLLWSILKDIKPCKTKLSTFQTEIEAVEFDQLDSATANMNKWVSDKTNAKIDHPFDPGALTRTSLVVLSAVYFKAKWSHVFEEGLTKHDADFCAADGRLVKCDMMQLRRQNFKLLVHPMGLRASVLEIPYDHYTLSCTIVLPDSDQASLHDVVDKIVAQPALVNALLRSSHESNALVNLHLPKFKFESEFEVRCVRQKSWVSAYFYVIL